MTPTVAGRPRVGRIRPRSFQSSPKARRSTSCSSLCTGHVRRPDTGASPSSHSGTAARRAVRCATRIVLAFVRVRPNHLFAAPAHENHFRNVSNSLDRTAHRAQIGLALTPPWIEPSPRSQLLFSAHQVARCFGQTPRRRPDRSRMSLPLRNPLLQHAHRPIRYILPAPTCALGRPKDCPFRSPFPPTPLGDP